jgi:MFS family permease
MILERQQSQLLLPLGTAMALSLTGDLTMYAVLANQIEVVGISLGVVGVLLGANRMIRIPGNLLAGALNDRLRRRPLFLAGLAMGVVSTVSYSLVHGFWPLLAGRLLWGLSWSLINVGGYMMILDHSTAADRGRMTGFYQMAFMLGLTISPLLGGMLTDAIGFRQTVRVCAAISAIGLLVALVALPETAPADEAKRHGLSAGGPRLRISELVRAWRQVDQRILRAGYVYLVAYFVNAGVLMSTISLYLSQRWGASISLAGVVVGVASLAGVMLSMRAVMGMLAGPIAGALSDRLSNRWPIVRGGILLGVVGFLVLALLAGVGAIPAGVAMISLSSGTLLTAVAALVGDLAKGDRQGITMGGLATAGDLGSATGPLLAYALAVRVDLRWVYLLCAIALATALLATLGQGHSRRE